MVSWMRATTRRFGLLVACAALTASGVGLAMPGSALAAKSSFTINGAGFGHGIGMSQYGALGFSLHHYSYSKIIHHYYENTSIGVLKQAPEITVLLEDGGLSFRRASAANGYALSPSRSYGALIDGSRIELISGGKSYGTYRTPLSITDKGTINVIGLGEYRGGLVLRGDGNGGIETVNKLPLQSYVRGVISAEMPSSWPLAALEAQAVAARTYAVAVEPASSTFDVYPDTRSQMYGGVSAETASTNKAAADTKGEIVEHDGLPAVTYFFSSSGGHTESIQNVWLGTEPLAWLKGVPDPYDNSGGNPYYRWKVKLSLTSAADRLRGLYKGTLKGIKVLKTGTSPRIISAEVVGTKGSHDVSGPQLQQLFSTMSTYMSFVTVTSSGTISSGGGASTATTTTTTATTTTPSGGGGLAQHGASSAPSLRVSGDVFPAAAGEKVSIERLSVGKWVKVATGALTSSGDYSVAVSEPGSYRTLVDGAVGPVVTAG
jgi:stage II sporulation protein D